MRERNHNACRARKHTFILSGFLYFKDTGGRSYAEDGSKWPDGESRYYDSIHPKGSYVKAKLLEESIEKYMHKIQLKKQYVKEVMGTVEKMLVEKRGDCKHENDRLTARKVELESAIRDLEDDRFIHKKISNEQFERINARFTNDLKVVAKALENNKLAYSNKIKQLERVLALAESIGEAFATADVSEKRVYLQIFVKRVWVKNKRICNIELNDNIKQLIEGGSICVSASWGGVVGEIRTNLQK